MSRVLFIYPGVDNESLAIEVLSACLKKAGHQTDLILNFKREKNFWERLKNRIKTFNPDFVAFSVMGDDYSWACEIAGWIKKKYKMPVIFGGIHVTSCPEEVINRDFVDFAVLGEGEEAIVELVGNPKRTNIKNVWFKKNNKIIKNKLRPLIQDLDSLPLQDRDIFCKEAPFLNEIYHCMTSRGCPFGCTYCFNNYLKKVYCGQKWLRKRSVEKVIRELEIMKSKLNYRQVLFVDDCFTYDKKWLGEFMKEYKRKINTPFKAIAHPLFIDKEIVQILKRGGCIRLQIGVQTPIESMRKNICKRMESNEDIKKAVQEIKKGKIMFQIDHIFGLPGEKIEDYKRGGIDFYIDLKPNYIASFFLQYFPNTEIVDIGMKCGELDQKTLDETIRGDVTHTDVIERAKRDVEILTMSRFFRWIPILPRWLSRYLVKNGRYVKLFSMRFFKSERFNRLPYLLQHFSSAEGIKTLFIVARRRLAMYLK